MNAVYLNFPLIYNLFITKKIIKNFFFNINNKKKCFLSPKFLKNHVTLKTGVKAAEKSVFRYSNTFFIYIYIYIY